jgi:hypothetical protein
MRTVPLLLVGLLVLASPSRGARAAEPAFDELVAAYEEAAKAKSSDEQVRLLGEIAKRAGESDRQKARSVLRGALGDRKLVVILAALDGYGTLAIPGSAADLRPYANRQAGAQRPHDVRLGAVAAWGLIHDPGTHPLLLDHVRLPRPEPEALQLALAALRALSEFRHVPPGVHRYELLDRTLITFLMLRDAAAGIGGVSLEATEWYASLRSAMLATWSHLTGETATSLTAAQAWWRANRRAIQAGTR